MTIPEPFTALETLDILISESQNELTRVTLQSRLAQRSNLRGIKNEQILAAFQSKGRNLGLAITDMKELRELVIKEEAEKQKKLEPPSKKD